jgi:hypothetical protein
MSMPSRSASCSNTSSSGTTWMPCARTISSGRSHALSVTMLTGRRASCTCPAAARSTVGVLHGHVLGLVRDQRAQRAQVREDRLRLVGVDVHLEHVRAADHDERVAAFAQPPRARGRLRQRRPAHQRLGAEAVRSLSAGYSTRAAAGHVVEDRRALQRVNGSPCTYAPTPSSRWTKPSAPASTTPACRSTGSRSGVRRMRRAPAPAAARADPRSPRVRCARSPPPRPRA